MTLATQPPNLQAAFLTSLQALGVQAQANKPVDVSDYEAVLTRMNQLVRGPDGHAGQAAFYPAGATIGGRRVLIPPVPFVVIGWPVRLAIWGLNPHYDPIVAPEEKAFALRQGKTWGRYADFHYSRPQWDPDAGWPGVLPYAVTSSYYVTIGKVLASLKKRDQQPGARMTSDDFKKAFSPRKLKNKKARAKPFWSLAQNFGVIMLEAIPFHSQTFPAMDQRWLACPAIQHYHQALLKVLDAVLTPDGLLCVVGRKAEKSARQVLDHQLQITQAFCPARKVRPCCLRGFWGTRRVSLTPFWRTRSGHLNSHQQLANWFNQI